MVIPSTINESLNEYRSISKNIIDVCFITAHMYFDKNKYIYINDRLRSKKIDIIQIWTKLSSSKLKYYKEEHLFDVLMFYDQNEFQRYFEVNFLKHHMN
jgi:hypothetical protein